MIILNELIYEINKVLKKLNVDESVEVRISNNQEYDFQINNFVKYQKHEKIKELSVSISKILSNCKALEEYNITKNYFINLKINFKDIVPIIQNIEEHIKKSNNEKIIIDYGGPNIGKPLHVGHLRSLNIGRSLYSINVLAGNDVKSDIHLGDWGMPVAQIINYCSKKNISIEDLKIDELVKIYPNASKLSNEDEEFYKNSQDINKKLNNLDDDVTVKWKMLKNLSLLSIKHALNKLNHDFDLWLGESDVNHLIPNMLKSLEKNNKIAPDDGAYISTMETDPKILITKSDGSYLYLTTDLATVQNRLNNEDFDKILYVVDNRQKFHFEQLFESLVYFEFEEKHYEHVAFGTVNDKNGNPFKTRDGDTKQLLELFDETYEHIKKVNPKLEDETLKTLANSVLTFSDLLTNRKTDYKFDLEKFTNISGKTGLYVQYALVRAKKLYEKSQLENDEIRFNFLEFDENDENLFRAFCKFEIYFKQSLEQNEPHHLAEFLYSISIHFNRLYQADNILNNKNETIKLNKLFLCSIFIKYSEILMKALGITPVDKM